MSSAGVIGFSLGLTTNAFVSGLDRARAGVGGLVNAGLKFPVVGAAVGGLVTSFLTLDAIVERTFGQIEKGAALADLSKRTGETVKDLFQLERGFEAGGLSADKVSAMLARARKALGGFNEMGEPTQDIFKGIGLSVDDLKDADAPEVFESILKKLGQLNRSEAQNAASKIFGGSGAGDALQMARNFEDVEAAMKGAAAQAALFDRNAQAFDRIDDSLRDLKYKGADFFAGIAAGAAPGIQAILDTLNKIDLSGLGQKIGDTLSVVAQSVKEGRFSEFIGVALEAGFEQGVNAIMVNVGGLVGVLKEAFSNGDLWAGLYETGIGVFAQLGSALLSFFEEPLMYIQAAMESAIQEVMEGLGKIPGVGKALGLEDFTAQSFNQILGERRDAGASLFGSTTQQISELADQYIESGVAALSEAGPRLAEAWQAGREAFRDFLGNGKMAELDALFEQLKGNLDQLGQTADANGKLIGTEGVKGKITGQANALERVGGLLARGGSGAGSDYDRQTSQNTARLVDEMRGLRQQLQPRRGNNDLTNE